MTNKQQALEELMAWCEKFEIELHGRFSGEIDLYHRGESLVRSPWFTPKSIDNELNRMKKCQK